MVRSSSAPETLRPRTAASDFLQAVAPYSSQQVAIAGQRCGQCLGVPGRFAHGCPSPGAVTVAQQPRRGFGLKSHSVEHVLVARPGEDLLPVREILMPRAM